jgi:hypothetical protein
VVLAGSWGDSRTSRDYPGDSAPAHRARHNLGAFSVGLFRSLRARKCLNLQWFAAVCRNLPSDNPLSLRWPRMARGSSAGLREERRTISDTPLSLGRRPGGCRSGAGRHFAVFAAQGWASGVVGGVYLFPAVGRVEVLFTLRSTSRRPRTLHHLGAHRVGLGAGHSRGDQSRCRQFSCAACRTSSRGQLPARGWAGVSAAGASRTVCATDGTGCGQGAGGDGETESGCPQEVRR